MSLSIGLIQMRCGARPDDNLSKAEALVRQAAKSGARIIYLPELFKSLYFCQAEDHKAIRIPGDVLSFRVSELIFSVSIGAKASVRAVDIARAGRGLFKASVAQRCR